MVRVVNTSNETVEIAGIEIKPHKIHIFDNLSIKDRQRLSAFSSVGIVRAYEGNYSNNNENKNITNNKKPVKKSNKKK